MDAANQLKTTIKELNTEQHKALERLDAAVKESKENRRTQAEIQTRQD
ncbi:hypothetical protein ES703_25442 [subsurface metagenome]